MGSTNTLDSRVSARKRGALEGACYTKFPILIRTAVIIERIKLCVTLRCEIQPLPTPAVEIPKLVTSSNDAISLLNDLQNAIGADPALNHGTGVEGKIPVQCQLLPTDTAQASFLYEGLHAGHECL